MNDRVEASEILSQPRACVVRRLWGVIATVLSVLYTAILLIPAAIVAPFDHGHPVSPLMRLWGRMILLTCGIKIELHGLQNLDGLDSFVLVSNHHSLFDIVAICHSIPPQIRLLANRAAGSRRAAGHRPRGYVQAGVPALVLAEAEVLVRLSPRPRSA